MLYSITITGNTLHELISNAHALFGSLVNGGGSGSPIAFPSATAIPPGPVVATNVAPPPPPAPPPATVVTGSEEVDSRGFRWDSRIHAETKAKNTDGTWRARRSITKALVESVESELRTLGYGQLTAPVAQQVVAAPPPTTVAPPPPVAQVVAPVAPDEDDDAGAPPPPPATVAPPPPPATVAPPPPPATVAPPPPAGASNAPTYESVIAAMRELLTAGKLTQHNLPAFWQKLGVAGPQQLMNNPDLIKRASDELQNVMLGIA